MAKEKLKTSYWDLQDFLKEIAKIPARLNRCDIVLKHELLEHIDIRIQRLLHTIHGQLLVDENYSYPLEYLPNKQFEYWAERVSSIFNYYELLRLKEYISNSMQIEINRNLYNHIFFEPGLDVFDYLNLHFNQKEKALTTKYTIIYLFFTTKTLIKGTTVDYLKFVKEYTNLEKQFSRLNFDSTNDKKYLKYEQDLTELYKEFLTTQD